MTLRLADKPVDLAETEPCPFPNRLSGKKGLKCMRNDFPGHPRSGIGYCQQDVLPDADLGVSRFVVLVEIDITGLDRHRPATRHRVSCVESEIYQCVFKLVRV